MSRIMFSDIWLIPVEACIKEIPEQLERFFHPRYRDPFNLVLEGDVIQGIGSGTYIESKSKHPLVMNATHTIRRYLLDSVFIM